jgi:hypothetical protein
MSILFTSAHLCAKVLILPAEAVGTPVMLAWVLENAETMLFLVSN